MNLPRPLRKLINPRETAVLKKDFREIWNSAGVRALLILLPLVFAGVIPIVFIVLSNLLPAQSFAGMDQLRALLGEAQSGMNDRQALFYLFSDCLGPMFFLLIPLLVSCIAAATSFLGERQHGTMETLFLTPLTTREIFKAKVIGCLVLSVLATLIAFLLFTVIMIVGDIQLGVTFFLANASWWVLLLLVAPGLILFGVLLMVVLNAHGTGVGESMQICGYVALPFILLFVAQFSGLFRLQSGGYLAIAAVIWVIDLFLWRSAARHFTTERLLR